MTNTHTIYCQVRKKEVAHTPEEEVRQKVIAYLIETCSVPAHLMSCEYPIKFNTLNHRADLVIIGKQAEPILIAEFKAPSVKISMDTLLQIGRYNHVLNVPFLLVTNGVDALFCKFDKTVDSYVQLDQIPNYNQMLDYDRIP